MSLHRIWTQVGGPQTTDSITPFNNQVRRLIHECVSPGPQAALFSVVAQIPLELRVWLRDEFDLQGEAVTTALTASNVFSQTPGVVGSAWGPDWKPQVDRLGFRTSWTHSVLVTVHDSHHPVMKDIWYAYLLVYLGAGALTYLLRISF